MYEIISDISDMNEIHEEKGMYEMYEGFFVCLFIWNLLQSVLRVILVVAVTVVTPD